LSRVKSHIAAFTNTLLWTSPDGETHNHIDQVLVEKGGIQIQLMSSLLGELTVILIITWWLQKFDVEKCNLKKLNDVEVKEQYQIKISNKFADFENWDVDMDISEAY